MGPATSFLNLCPCALPINCRSLFVSATNVHTYVTYIYIIHVHHYNIFHLVLEILARFWFIGNFVQIIQILYFMLIFSLCNFFIWSLITANDISVLINFSCSTHLCNPFLNMSCSCKLVKGSVGWFQLQKIRKYELGAGFDHTAKPIQKSKTHHQ